MSIEAVNQFLKRVSEDQKLQKEVKVAMEAEQNTEAVTELAAKYGFEYTPDELKAEIENRKVNLETDELSEEDLSAVAGGMPCLLGVLNLTTKNVGSAMTGGEHNEGVVDMTIGAIKDLVFED